MSEKNVILKANQDGISIEDSESKRLDEEIGRLNYLLIEWEHWKTKENVQKEIDRLEGMKKDQSYLTS